MAGRPLNELETADICEQLKQFELPNVKFTGKKLGTGSYGSVEVVEIPGASCAAKTIHELLVQSVAQQGGGRILGGGYVQRSIIKGFVTECTLMSTLRHPHIVQFLGICYPPGAQLPTLVMELLMTSLYNMLESTSDIPMSIKRSILRDVARGLMFLHSLSLIHRDLTASNVLVDSSLTAKIADLGMTRLLNIQAGRHAATMTKGPGNASYMPPEAKDGVEDVIKYGKPIDTFSLGNLILFTATQKCPDPKHPTYFDEQSGTKARTEIERRIDSFQLLWQMFGKEHPFVLLANQCLQDNPRLRPTAPEILQRLEAMHVIPYRDWSSSKLELVQGVLSNEQENARLVSEHQKSLGDNARLVSEHQKSLGENARLVSEHQKSLGENARLVSEHQKSLGENARLVSEHQETLEENARLVSEHQQTLGENARLVSEHQATLWVKEQTIAQLQVEREDILKQFEQLKSNRETQTRPRKSSETMFQSAMQSSVIMSAGGPSPKRREVSRDDIVSAILSIRVGPGQPLRQVQVPPEVYQAAKKFVTTAPNFLGGSEPYRFKVLYRMSSGRSIYELLIADAANISLNDAEAKISGWQEASKALLRYALNLLLAPKRPEFQRLKLSSSYYVYQVAKKLKGAEEILVSMGFQSVSGSQEVQELKYMEGVNTLLVADTAADLVVLDGELTRVKGLVTFARNENYAISLIHILQARSHRTETFEHTIHTAARLATHGSFQTQIVFQQSAVSGSPAYHNPRSKEYHNPRSKQQPHLQLIPQEPQHKSMQHDRPLLEPDCRRGSAPGILDDLPRHINQVGSWPIVEEQDREGGNHYYNLPGLYVNYPQSSSERQQDDYSEVRFDHGDKVHVGGAPNPLNRPEPIVHDEAELARLQATNPGGDYHTVSLITDARSDPVGFGGPSFDSIISFRSSEHASQYNQDAEDEWKIVPNPPKLPSEGSNGSLRSIHSNTNTSGSEDIYDSDYEDRRQHVTVLENKVPANKPLKRYDSDYDDYDVVEQNVSENTHVNYDHQSAMNKTRRPDKEYVKLPHEKKENTFAKQVPTKAAAQSNKHDYANQEAIDKQQVNSPSENLSRRQMNLETPGTDRVAKPISGSHSQSSYGESNSSGEFHTYENDPLYCQGAGPNQKVERVQSSEKPPIPSPRTPNITAVQKPKPLHRQSKQSSDVSVDANCPPKPRSSPLSSLESQEIKSLPKSYTSPLSNLQSFSYREQIFDSSLGLFVDEDATPKTLDSLSQSSLTKASTASATTSETTHDRSNFNSPPPCNSPATNPRSTNNIFVSGISGPSSLSNESPRRRSNAMSIGRIHLLGAMPNRPSNLSVHPDQSREHLSSHNDLDTSPEKREQSRSKQAVSPKTVGTVYSQTQEPDTPAAVFGTWTCSYCTNIVFLGSVCEVCGNKRKEGIRII